MNNLMAASTPAPNLLIETIEANGPYGIGVIRLDRPKALNALNLPMTLGLYSQLSLWHCDPKISAVVLTSNHPTAFCVGGDIKQLYESLRQSNNTPSAYAADYFSREYQLNYLIHSYQKPMICWGNGPILGGGLGLFWGANIRIVTSSAKLAWPEVTIGFYPDVGGTYALSHLPKPLGALMGMTGASLDPTNALAVGLADYWMPDEQLNSLLLKLCSTEWPKNRQLHQQHIRQCLLELTADSTLAATVPYWILERPTLEWLYSDSNLGNIWQRFTELQRHYLTAQKLTPSQQWLALACTQLLHGSPRAAAIAFTQTHRGQNLSLRQCFEQEWHLSMQCCQSPDLLEGIRAQLIDRDRTPHWREPQLDSQSSDWINAWFEPFQGQSPDLMLSRLAEVDTLIETSNHPEYPPSQA